MFESMTDIIRDIASRAEIAERQDGDATVHHSAVASMLRDLEKRIGEAYRAHLTKGDMCTMECVSIGNELNQYMEQMKRLADENASLKKCVGGKCERMEVDAELCSKCPWAEVWRLKAENASLKNQVRYLRIRNERQRSALSEADVKAVECSAEVGRLKAQLKAVGDYSAQTYELKEALRCIARSARAALKEEDV